MMSDSAVQEMPIPIGPNLVARIPFMTEEDYKFFLSALTLYKPKFVKAPLSTQPKEGSASDWGGANISLTPPGDAITFRLEKQPRDTVVKRHRGEDAR